MIQIKLRLLLLCVVCVILYANNLYGKDIVVRDKEETNTTYRN